MNAQELKGYQIFGKKKFSEDAKKYVLKELEGKSRIGLKVKKTLKHYKK